MIFLSLLGLLIVVVQLEVLTTSSELAIFVAAAALFRVVANFMATADLRRRHSDLVQRHEAEFGDGRVRKFLGEIGPLAKRVTSHLVGGFGGEAAGEGISQLVGAVANMKSAAELQSEANVSAIADRLALRRSQVFVGNIVLVVVGLVAYGVLPLKRASSSSEGVAEAPARVAEKPVEAPFPSPPRACMGDPACAKVEETLSELMRAARKGASPALLSQASALAVQATQVAKSHCRSATPNCGYVKALGAQARKLKRQLSKRLSPSEEQRQPDVSQDELYDELEEDLEATMLLDPYPNTESKVPPEEPSVEEESTLDLYER